MTVKVIIPWRGGCAHRTRALTWVLEQYAHEGFDVTVAEYVGDPWCKALAVNPTIESSSADVVVVADADVWTTGIPEAVHRLEQHGGWAVPHQEVRRLTAGSTDDLLADRAAKPRYEETYMGLRGGGVVVAERRTLIDVPLDPRFKGWGDEDSAWAWALWTLVGRPWRGTGQLTHLWHPPQKRIHRNLGSVESRALFKRYKAARPSQDAMRALIEEGRAHVGEPVGHRVHDHLPVR